ncbi:MAG TPA: hypothetical protein VFE17_02715 [Candidatus Baltobacteraceae bacterium]|jgi:hypothetical protein|nr:hypothetical protein [Candidatus Baltobacteraceae bacterium]
MSFYDTLNDTRMVQIIADPLGEQAPHRSAASKRGTSHITSARR